MTHGTRQSYQQGRCHCVSCRSANAAYQSEYRRLKARGKQPLGSLVSAVGAARRLNELSAEGLKRQDVARLFGLKRPILEFHTGDDAKMTLRSYLRLKRLHRERLLEGIDGPDEPLTAEVHIAPVTKTHPWSVA